MKRKQYVEPLPVTLVLLGFVACATADSVQLVSVKEPATNPPASANGDSGLPVITADGSFVLFVSSANDLPVTTNGLPVAESFPPRLNVFLQDRTNAVPAVISVNLAGTGGGKGDSLPAGLSDNGRYALFESSAADLAANDTNGASDVFVRDLVTATTTVVSVSTNGGVGNGASRNGVMTPDGRYVAFVSAANSLVPDDTNGIPDVFLRDLQAGTTTLVSVAARTAGRTSEAPQITPDGRYVAFYSTATDLVAGVTNVSQIYVRDVQGGTTAWASADASCALLATHNNSNAFCFSHSVSADGQFVAYAAAPRWTTSLTNSGIILRYSLGSGITEIVHTNAAVPATALEDACNLALTPDGRFIAYLANVDGGGVTNTCVLVWDAQTGINTLASGDLVGAVPTKAICDWPTITPDGRYVAFLSTAINLTTNLLVGEFHLYVRDLQAGTTALIDADTNGVGIGVSPTGSVCLSADGRFATFAAPSGLLSGDDNRHNEVFVRDLLLRQTELISARQATLPFVTPNGYSMLSPLCVNGDGRYIAFASEADNLVAHDTNGFRDVFVRDVETGSNILVSVGSNGVSPADGLSSEPSISAEGRFVAFTSSAADLVPGDTNNVQDVFVRDLLTGTTVLVSVNTNGTSGNRDSSTPALSADGRIILFHSFANDLVAGAFGDGVDNVFWRDLSLNVTYPVSTNTTTVVGTPGHMFPATMTADGRYVAFGNTSLKWYVWDAQLHGLTYTNSTGGGILSDVDMSGDGNWIAYLSGSLYLYVANKTAGTNFQLTTSVSRSPCFSADGRFLAYQTTTAKVAGDTNGFYDIYIYDFQTKSNHLVSRALIGSANGASDSPDINLAACRT